MKLHFKIYEEDNGYWISCQESCSLCTQADTLDELYKNILEVLSLFDIKEIIKNYTGKPNCKCKEKENQRESFSLVIDTDYLEMNNE